MGFRFKETLEEKREEEYELKYIDYDGENVHITEFKNRSVTSEMKSNMRMNSYAQDDLPPKLTTEALIETAKLYQSQCSRPRLPCSTYDESLIHRILPELIKRLEERS
ncbi:hypothetical protein P8918_12510 [Bacillus spizizenii]|nr:hypothetical protein [Bacillus spizizenii]MCY8890392.1 hypothetical protein [Bacillus spizizenii]MEC0841847.1 hypothetical protein [Bacillus spizizenii]